MKKEIKIIGQHIINAEREIALGRDNKLHEDEIENYMKNLSPTDLMDLVFYLENELLDKKENF